MKAMIFAAGLGTRLRPLTNNKPKALVTINGISLLEITIRRLLLFGYNEIIINTHHFASQIILLLKQKNNFGANIQISDETDLLLNTGGGLKKAAWFLGATSNENGRDGSDKTEPFLLCNVDVLNTVNLDQLRAYHKQQNALVTLAVRNRSTSRYLLFDETQQLCGWKNNKTQEEKVARVATHKTPLAFSGIQLINPQIFDLIKQTGAFSIIDTYLDLAAQHKIVAYQHDKDIWLDVGKHDALAKAKELLPLIELATP